MRQKRSSLLRDVGVSPGTTQPPVTIKAEMYRLYFAGRLGNQPHTWNSLAEIERSGYRGEVSLRSRQTSHPVRLYHVPYDQLAERVRSLPESYHQAGFVFSEAPPDRRRTLQGEIQERPGGLALTYSLAKAPMRIAFDQDLRYASGLTAKLLLQQHLDPSDYDWLRSLLDDWPEHVVEFSGFQIPVGTLRRRMIVWELRAY